MRQRTILRDSARLGHAVHPQWGSGGRGFKSRRPDLDNHRATTYGGFGRRLLFRGSARLIPQLAHGACWCLAITYRVWVRVRIAPNSVAADGRIGSVGQPLRELTSLLARTTFECPIGNTTLCRVLRYVLQLRNTIDSYNRFSIVRRPGPTSQCSEDVEPGADVPRQSGSIEVFCQLHLRGVPK